MNERKAIMKRKREAGWIIDTNSGLIGCDKEGRWWFSGGTAVHIAIFKDKKQAMKIRKKVYTERPDLITRSWVLKLSFCVVREP